MRSLKEEWQFLHGLPEEQVDSFYNGRVNEVSDVSRLCKSPVVSVLVPIWNHHDWLDQCISSIVAQKCSFDFEILLCEDHSTDDSLVICKKWQQNYPALIRIVSGETNLGAFKNADMGFRCARGDYIALVEGDDYWTDSQKLQKQVDLLHSGRYRIVVALNQILDSNTGRISESRIPKCDELSLHNLDLMYYHTSTYIFEKTLRQSMVSYFKWVKAYDTVFLRLALSLCGRIGVLNEYVSVYRKTGNGIYTSLTLSQKGEDGVRDAIAFYRHSPRNILPLAKHNYCSALFNYVAYKNYGGERSVRHVLAFMLGLSNITFAVNKRRILFLAGSALKSFFANRRDG